jgi:hypothetical protein
MNRPYTLYVLMGLIAIVVMSSCTRKFYVPNPIFSPDLHDQGDFAAEGFLLGGDEISGAGAHAAISPIKHLAFAGSFSYMQAANREDPSRGYIWDASIGTYFPGKKFNTEIYAGYGKGYNQLTLGVGSEARLNMNRYQAQSTFTINTKYIQFFFGGRVSLLEFTDGIIVISDDFNDRDKIELIRERSPFFMIEPTWGFRLGNEYIKFVLQRTSNFSKLSRENMTTNVANIGLHINSDIMKPKHKRRVYPEHPF